jgi:phage terminase Nu1 subunit (DNA packaging protein)
VKVDLSQPCTQLALAELVGVSQQAISALVTEGKLPSGGTLGQLLLAYCERLREQAAGRLGDEDNGLSLTGERAALARAQREGIEIKNAVLRGEYAAISLLAETLASASQAVAERFDQLPGRMRQAVPDLPAAALEQALAVVADARGEWVRSTVALVAARIEAEPELDVDDEPRAD